MSGELRVFDHNYKPVGTIYPAHGISVAFMRNGAAPATFLTPKTGLRYSEAYLRAYNRVEYHDGALPQVWTGVILDHEFQDADVAVSCMSSEHLFSTRYTDLFWANNGDQTAGQIAQSLWEQAVKFERMGVACGALDRSGPTYYAEYSLKPVSEALSELAERSGGDWWVEKTSHRHIDLPALRWSNRRGSDKSGAVAVSGEVVDLPAYKKSGSQLATFAHVVGGGSGPEIWQRLYLPVEDKTAKQVYGRIETKLEFSDIVEIDLLEQAGRLELHHRSKLLRTLGCNIDNRRNMWGQFWLGDTIRATLSGVDFAGFDGAVTVQGVQGDVDGAKLGLVVELP
jgi:hypothetical protein